MTWDAPVGPTPDQSERASTVTYTVEVRGEKATLSDDDLRKVHAHLNGTMQSALRSDGVHAHIVGIWNTGCSWIYNGGPGPIYIVDGEDPGETLGLNSGADIFRPNYPWVVPWCDSWSEVRNKAWRVFDGPSSNSPLRAYIFQNYKSSLVQWCRAELVGQPGLSFGGSTLWDQPSSWMNIGINLDAPGVQILGSGWPPYGPINGFNN